MAKPICLDKLSALDGLCQFYSAWVCILLFFIQALIFLAKDLGFLTLFPGWPNVVFFVNFHDFFFFLPVDTLACLQLGWLELRSMNV